MSDRVAIIDQGRFRQIGKPRDIYERPASRFIAEFIGESSFLPVTVRNGAAHFGPNALRLAAPIEDSATEQFLIVRPEKVRLLSANEASGDNEFDGVVKEIVYQGESSLLYITLGSSHEIAIRQPSIGATMPSTPGQPVRLAMAPGDSIIVTAEGRP